MVWCRNLSRVLTVLGLCALGVACSGAAMAAPLCARVMMPEISAAEITTTITSLAEMKMRLDLLHTEGLNSQEFAILSEMYPIKLAELQSALRDKYSEKEIHRLLSTEIAKLQGRGQEHAALGKAREQEHRQALRRLLPAFGLEKTISLPFLRRNKIDFIPEHNSIIYESDGTPRGLMRLDLNTGQEIYLSSIVDNWSLLPDRRTLLVRTDDKSRIFKIDILTKEVKEVAKNYRMDWLSIDPTGEVLMLKGSGGPLFLDLKTGESQHLPWKANEYPILLSKNEILAKVRSGTYVYNLDTKSKQYLKVHASWDKFEFLSDGGQRFALYSYDTGKFTFFDLQNLSQAPKEQDLHLSGEYSISLIGSIPSQPFAVARRFYGTHRQYEIYHTEDMSEPLFVFPKYGAPITEPNVYRSLESFQFSSDGNDLAVLEKTETDRVRTYELHVWKRK